MTRRFIILSLAFIITLSCFVSLLGCDINKKRTVIDVYGDGFNVNMVVGFDQQGRTVNAVYNEDDEKEIGLFYFLWLNKQGGPYVNSKILEKYGVEGLLQKDLPGISPAGAYHWWDEPLFGFYNSNDDWVIRKHLEMFVYSGIDFLVFDTTNAVTYTETYIKVLKIANEMLESGWDVPKMAFFTHTRSVKTITDIYNNLYAKNLYPDTWYKIDGKPMIIGTVTEDDPLSPEIAEFFHLRTAKWPQDPTTDTAWPFTEWVYPQPLNGNMMSVSVATHPALPFSASLSRGNLNWGRGYNVKTAQNVAADVYKGTFFQSQWQTVFEVQPEIVFITGWNEWIAGKYPFDGEYSFCDNVNLEFSREIEPMRGGYEDAFYIQMMMNVRKYKYESMDNYIAKSTKKKIDILFGDLSQWDDVNAIYRNINIANIPRDYLTGYAKESDGDRYTQDAARNNIEYIKVTCNERYLYFLIKCDKPIVETDGNNFMNIFIGLGEKPSMTKGWESYEYVINRTRPYDPYSNVEKFTYIEKLSSSFVGERCGEGSYFIKDDYMQFQIPRDEIGLKKGGSFYFKVSDGVENYNDIMSYYESGISMPIGRLSFLYQID